MTTAAIDAIGAEIAPKTTPLEDPSSLGIDLDMRRLRHGYWEQTGNLSRYPVPCSTPYEELGDEAGSLVSFAPKACRKETLALQLRELHREPMPLTYGTVQLHFFQVALR